VCAHLGVEAQLLDSPVVGRRHPEILIGSRRAEIHDGVAVAVIGRTEEDLVVLGGVACTVGGANDGRPPARAAL
jgi:hypothetical protein